MPPNSKESLEILESGTSLAEQEYDSGRAPINGSAKSIVVSGVSSSKETEEAIEALRVEIAQDLLGTGNPTPLTFTSPFEVPTGSSNISSKRNCGRYLYVPLVYCDQTASNRTVRSIENYMQKICLPLYGNTHTNTSITGAQSTAFVAEARQIVAEETNARITGKASLDVVLFSGSGTTAAVELLIDCMGLKYASQDADKKPIVFVGPHEHHSNIVPWRESGAEIIAVPECAETGTVDYEALERLLENFADDKRLKMGTFTAASNVNGKVSDVDRISATLHRHGALAFFDYATAAPYMSMDMNPSPSCPSHTASLVAKDAIYFSPHKMIGGIGTPGVLIVKKHLVNQQNAPSRSGGGTVFYVSNTHHRFLSNRIERYEGGTPNVAGIIRVGLTFLFKRQVEQKYQLISNRQSTNLGPSNNQNLEEEEKGADGISQCLQDFEYRTYNRVAGFLRENASNLVLLDGGGCDKESPHLPIFSFLIKCGNRFLHYNYVCAILNDVFGIQSRGGCQCAGPYSQRLLGLSKVTTSYEVPNPQNEAIEHALLHYKERAELLRPGYTRLSLPFKGLRSEEAEYVMKALVWTAKNAWALMCNYRCNHRTGEWRHAARQGKPLGKTERKWLSHYDRTSQVVPDTTNSPKGEEIVEALGNALANADRVLEFAKSDQRSISEAMKMNGVDGGPDTDKVEKLRWYVYPKEIASFLSQGLQDVPGTDSSELHGGIKPLACVSADPRVCPGNDGMTTTIPPLREKKRKQAALKESESAGMMPTDNDRFSFRDGEHSGEAPFSEIEMGFNDEELSTKCEVYDQQKGEWLPIESFIRTRKKLKTTQETVREEKSPVKEGRNVTMDDSNNGPDTKNEKKKPARGANSWGQGNFVQPKLCPASGKGESNMNAVGDKASDCNGSPVKKGKQKHRHVRPPAKMMRQITQAVIQWNMLEEGDRLLLGLSGGKDSLSLLHCLMECQRKMPIKFEIEVCTIDPMTPSFDPSPLIPYVESLGLKYHYIRDDIVARANTAGKDGKTVSSLCSYCARMKRGNLYTCARKNNCNKLVLAQHLDDCAESFLMSVMHNGFLRTMKAHYKIDAGDLAVIRPLVYCRESLMTNFAKSVNLPVINENCPACFEEPKERARTKKLLSREETLYPNFYDNIRRSLIPLMHDDMSGILRGYTEETVSKSRKEPHKGGKKNGDKASGKEKVCAGPQSDRQEESGPTSNISVSCATEEELLIELAKRKANRSRAPESRDSGDPTGQVCTLNGGNGSIPCRELME